MGSIRSNTLALLFLVASSPLLGQPTWRAVVGGLGEDEGACVRATVEGNAVVVGNTGSFGNGSSDAYVVMLDGVGELLWSRVYGGTQIDRATALCIDEDGSLLVAGYTNGGGLGGYDGWLFKTDPQGVLIWQRYYGGLGWDFFHDLEPSNGGGWLLSGATGSQGAGAGDGWLVGIDADGEELFSLVLGGAGEDEFRSAVATVDGGVVATGARDLGSGNLDAWVVKLDPDNSVEWEELIGGDSVEVGRDVLETLDGGFSVVGTTGSVSTYVQHVHFKLNNVGDSLWARIGGGDVNDQEAMDHVELSSGTFAIVGCTKTGGGGGKDLYLQVSDPEGEFIVGHTFGLTEDDIGYSITETTDGFFVCGSYGSTPQIGAGNKDVFIVRCDSVVDTETEVMTDTFDPTGIAGLSKQLHISVFPNPAFLSTRLVGCQNLISAQLLDPQGRLARQWIRPVPQDLDLQGLSSGAYQLVTTNEAGARSSQTLIIAAP